MDNASNNNTMMLELQQEGLDVDADQRLRCAGHIINLVAKAVMSGKGLTEFTKEVTNWLQRW